jgi:hydroxymethylpyrimidine/phosphomethylpyrimidine kinase
LAIALTIAGSDPSGGAGIQADLKTFHQLGVYGEAAITLLTVQNTRGVARVDCLQPDLVADQIAAVLEDMPPDAAKTGALGTAEIVYAVALAAREFAFPLVVDPVMISKYGAPLISGEARMAILEELVPRAFLLMPNLPEASALAGIEILVPRDVRRAAKALAAAGARNVLIKGGHLAGPAMDTLLTDGEFVEYTAARISTPHTHGTGCAYSAAITAELAKGVELRTAIEHAKRFITEAIRTNPGLGHGCGPLNYFCGVPDRPSVHSVEE